MNQIWKNKNFLKKKEKVGVSVQDFLDEENQRDIVEYLAFEMKNINNKNVAVISFETEFPYYEQISELFTSIRRNCNKKNLKCGHFYINKKQKAYEFEPKWKILLKNWQ